MDVEELSYSVSLAPVTLVVLVLLLGFTPVEGQSQVIGSLQPIVVSPGDDVILPCHVEPPLSVMGLTVEWSRPDLQRDPKDWLSRVEYVHLYRDNREVPDMKLSSFVRRTTLFPDGLRQGNISLKIMNVTLADEGRFQCFIPKLEGRVRSAFVHLVVEPNSAKNWTTETPIQPRSPQTPDLRGETDVKGGLSSRNRLSLVVVFCVFLTIMGVGVATYLTKKCQEKQFLQLFKEPTVEVL